MQPNHFWPDFPAFKTWTSLSNNVIFSRKDLANIKISSANFKSKSGGKPSPGSNPNEHPSAHVRHFDIAIWKVRLFPFCLVTSPCWPRYRVRRIHNIWVDTPCSDEANHKAPLWQVQAQNLLDSLVRHLAAAGLMLNTWRTVALTTAAQPPSFIQDGDSHMIKVLGHTKSHKWLGCMLCACRGQDSDVENHLQQAAKAFQKPLDVTMQGVFYQTSTALFRSNCFFNSFLRCRAPAFIQKTF